MPIIRKFGTAPVTEEGDGGIPTPRQGTEFRALFQKAHEAGIRAGSEAEPKPTLMVQTGSMFRVDDQPGFVWITVKPANCAFARWLMANNIASKAYGGGVQIWVADFRQSRVRQIAYADAMIAVLRQANVARSITSDSRD